MRLFYRFFLVCAVLFSFSCPTWALDTPIPQLREAAEKGDKASEAALTELYIKMKNGTGREYAQYKAQAFDWFKFAADTGDADAETELASFYEQGLYGAPIDRENAATLYRKAADQGKAEAQYRLGRMYQRGFGVERDNVQAALWFTLANSSFTYLARHYQAAESAATSMKSRK